MVVLGDNPDFPERDRVVDWLDRADEAMKRRNSVLHGEAGVDWNTFDEADMGASGLLLTHKPRRGEKQMTVTRMKVEEVKDVLADLNTVSRRLSSGVQPGRRVATESKCPAASIGA